MSVKTTKLISVEDAIEKYVSLKVRSSDLIFRLRAEAVSLGKEGLERALERMNDAANDGEGFENYEIVGP